LAVCPSLLSKPSKSNKPEAYHVYSMRQAIEEGFILDVLKNYTNYKVAYNLAQKIDKADQEVESKKPRSSSTSGCACTSTTSRKRCR